MIRENLRNIENNLQDQQATNKKQLKETEIKQLIENNLYIYFLNNKNNIVDFENINKKEETKQKICEILKNEDIEDFKIKAYLNKTYNKILELVKKDIKQERETTKQCLQRVLNNHFENAEDIEKTYNSLKIIKNRDLICYSIIEQNKNICKYDLLEYIQKNYYKDLNYIYKIHKEDQKAKEFFSRSEKQEQETNNKKSFSYICGQICGSVLIYLFKIFLIFVAVLIGLLCGVTKKKK